MKSSSFSRLQKTNQAKRCDHQGCRIDSITTLRHSYVSVIRPLLHVQDLPDASNSKFLQLSTQELQTKQKRALLVTKCLNNLSMEKEIEKNIFEICPINFMRLRDTYNVKRKEA